MSAPSALEAAKRTIAHFPNAVKIGDTVRLLAMAPDAVRVARAYIKACEALENAAVHLDLAASHLDKAGWRASAQSARDDAVAARTALSCSAPPEDGFLTSPSKPTVVQYLDTSINHMWEYRDGKWTDLGEWPPKC